MLFLLPAAAITTLLLSSSFNGDSLADDDMYIGLKWSLVKEAGVGLLLPLALLMVVLWGFCLEDNGRRTDEDARALAAALDASLESSFASFHGLILTCWRWVGFLSGSMLDRTVPGCSRCWITSSWQTKRERLLNKLKGSGFLSFFFFFNYILIHEYVWRCAQGSATVLNAQSERASSTSGCYSWACWWRWLAILVSPVYRRSRWLALRSYRNNVFICCDSL